MKKIDTYTVSYRQALFYFLITLFLGQVVGALIMIPASFVPEIKPLINPLSFLLSFLAVLLVLATIKQIKIRELGDFLKPSPHLMVGVLCLLLFVATMPLAEFCTGLVPTEGYPLLEDYYNQLERIFIEVLGEPISGFLTICILAPILEEFIFRGIILRGLLNGRNNPWISIGFTALLFGLAHLNPWQLVGAGLLGFIFGFVYWRTQSLWFCMFLHFVNNSIAFVITMQTQDLESTIFEPHLALLGVSVIAIAGLIYLILKNTKEIQPYKN